MRSMRSTSIHFGLVNILVKVYKATESHDVEFHQYHKDCMGSVGYVKACKECGETLSSDTIVRGADCGDTIVTISEDELATIETQAGPEIEVERFIDAGEVDPIAYESHYYLAPATAAAREGYALLRQVMIDKGQVAVVRFVLRRTGSVGKSHLGLLRPYGDNQLVVHTMSYPDEIREPAGLPHLDRPVELKPELVAMAHTIVDAMSGSFVADEYTDTFTDKLNEMIAAKSRGETIMAADGEPVEPTGVDDLLAKLQASAARLQPVSG